MIAIDTNVLLRYLRNDDPVQSSRAAALFEKNAKILLTDVVLTETVWTLKGKKYNLNRDAIAGVINALFEEPAICFEDGQTVWRALNDFRKAPEVKVGGKRRQAEFADALITNKARHYASNAEERLEGVFTSDLAARELSDTKSP